MKLLHEDEFACIQYLLENYGNPLRIRGADIEYSGYFDFHKSVDFLQALHEAQLIEINKVEVDFGGVFMDAFLRKYAKLIKNNKVAEARESAREMGLETLNKLLVSYGSLPELWKVIEETLKADDDLLDTEFSKDIYDGIYVSFEVKPKIKVFYKEYLEAFQKDQLKKPEPTERKEWWEGGSYFKRDFFRYKKQRQLMLDILRKKVDTKNPAKLEISHKDLPFDNLNIRELISCLESEGIILKTEEGFDWEEISLVVSVNEDQLLEQESVGKNDIKLNLSFTPLTGIFILEDRTGNQHKIRIQGQVQKEIMRLIFSNLRDTYSEWSLYDISETLGAKDVDVKAVKNAIYQINKKVRLEIPQVEKLFELSSHSLALNKKYLLN